MFLCLPQSCNTICKLGCYKGADTNILPGVCGLIMGLFAMEYFIILFADSIILLLNNPPETSFDILKSLPFLVQIKTKSETLMFRPIFYNGHKKNYSYIEFSLSSVCVCVCVF